MSNFQGRYVTINSDLSQGSVNGIKKTNINIDKKLLQKYTKKVIFILVQYFHQHSEHKKTYLHIENDKQGIKNICVYENGLTAGSKDFSREQQINKIKIGHVNINGITGKKLMIEEFIIKSNLDIFSINETWQRYRAYFRNPDKGGGVCIIVRDEIRGTEISSINLEQSERFITIKIDNMLITSCYMPDNNKSADIKDQAYDYINTLLAQFPNNPQILVGDFNALLLNFGSNPQNDYDNSLRFKEFLQQNDLEIVNNASSNTIIHKGTGQMYCNDYIVHNSCFVSDHIPMTVDFIFITNLYDEKIYQRKFKISRLQDPIDRQKYRNSFLQSYFEFFQIDQDNLDDQYEFIRINIEQNADQELGSFIPDPQYNKLPQELTRKYIDAKRANAAYKEAHAYFGRVNQKVIDLQNIANKH